MQSTVPAPALAQHVNLPPELWVKIFQELDDHPDTMRSASLACTALRGVAQELLFRHVVIKEPSRIVRLIIPEVSRRVAALTTRLSLLVPSEDTEEYKQRVLGPVYALLAHALPGSELQLRYLRITSGLLAQLYDVFMDVRRPRSPPAEEDEDVIGVGAQEAVDASEAELHGLQALQELAVVYEPTTCSSSSAHNAHALQHVCTAYGNCLTVVRLDGVAQGAERLLLTVVYTALGERLVSFTISLGRNQYTTDIPHLWPTDTLRLEGMHFPVLRYLELDERQRHWVSHAISSEFEPR